MKYKIYGYTEYMDCYIQKYDVYFNNRRSIHSNYCNLSDKQRELSYLRSEMENVQLCYDRRYDSLLIEFETSDRWISESNQYRYDGKICSVVDAFYDGDVCNVCIDYCSNIIHCEEKLKKLKNEVKENKEVRVNRIKQLKKLIDDENIKEKQRLQKERKRKKFKIYLMVATIIMIYLAGHIVSYLFF